MSMLFLMATAVLAQDPINPFEEPDESEMYRLQEQLVTVASRYEQTVRMAPSIVELIDADQIRERGYRTLADVLRDVNGFYMWKSNEGRDLAAVRGIVSADNNKLLLLVDGIPWYDGVYTHAFLGDYFPLSHIKQIEVIQGPGSAIYGTNAFAGVVNIVTQSGEDYDGARIRLMSGAIGRTELTAMAGVRRRDGSNETNVSVYARVLSQLGDGLSLVPRGRSDIPGYDPKRSVNVGTKVLWNNLQGQLHHVDYQHQYLVNEADSPDSITAKYLDGYGFNYQNTYFSLLYQGKVNRNVSITPVLWGQRHNNPGAYVIPGGITLTADESGMVTGANESYETVETEKDTFRWGGEVRTNIRPGIDHVLLAGLGIENIEVLGLSDNSFINGSHDMEEPTFAADTGASVRNLYGYTQYTWTIMPELEMTAGGRLDKRIPSNDDENNSNDVFKLFASPRVGLLLVPTDRFNAKLLYQRAFRAPSVRELLVRAEPDADGNYEWSSGNLDLRPEGTHTAEAELTITPNEFLTSRVFGAWSKIENEIDKVAPPNQYQNLPGGLQVFAAGAEVTADIRRWYVRAAYGLTAATYSDSDGPYAGLSQYEFPPHMLKANIGYELIDDINAYLTAEAYSKRPRGAWAPDSGMSDGSAFALIHGSLSSRNIGKTQHTHLGVSVRNLLDTKWSTGVYRDDANAVKDGEAKYPLGVEGEGRSVHVSIEFQL